MEKVPEPIFCVNRGGREQRGTAGEWRRNRTLSTTVPPKEPLGTGAKALLPEALPSLPPAPDLGNVATTLGPGLSNCVPKTVSRDAEKTVTLTTGLKIESIQHPLLGHLHPQKSCPSVDGNAPPPCTPWPLTPSSMSSGPLPESLTAG